MMHARRIFRWFAGQTWTNEDYSGDYLGGYSITNTNCFPANGNGIEEVAALLAVAQNGSAMSITATTSVATCTFGGTYSQTGKLGQVNGNYSCTSGVQGSFALVEMTPDDQRIHGADRRAEPVLRFRRRARRHPPRAMSASSGC